MSCGRWSYRGRAAPVDLGRHGRHGAGTWRYYRRSMVPEDGDPAPPNAASSAAFAATIAPTSSDAPTPPPKLPDGTKGASKPPHDSGLDATVAAPVTAQR